MPVVHLDGDKAQHHARQPAEVINGTECFEMRPAFQQRNKSAVADFSGCRVVSKKATEKVARLLDKASVCDVFNL
jgi:hypothetical protein